MKHIGLYLILFAGMIVTIGDIVMKKWMSTNIKYFFIIGVSIWTIGGVFLALSYKYQNIAVASMMMIIVNITVLTLFSWFYFKETLNAYQLIGLVLGIISVSIMELA